MMYSIGMASCGMIFLSSFMKIGAGIQAISIFFILYSEGWSPIGSTRHCGHQ
jgi:hypothetical protein